MDYKHIITTETANLLNCTEHESDDRLCWVFLHNNQWHVTDIEPERIGYTHLNGKQVYYCDVKVKEVFNIEDTQAMLDACRANGFHSWKEDGTSANWTALD